MAFPPFHPAIVAYLVLAYIVYFSYKSIRTIYYAWISFAIFERSVNLDWQGTLEESEMDYSDVIHVALITNAIEPVEIVDRTVECLQNQTFPVKQTIVLLALEKRFEETAKARADFIKKKYRGVFKDIIDTYHPLLPGEVVGKASNAAFAAKELYEYVQKKGLDPKKVVVTVMDTDSQLHHSYYSCLTYKYLKDAKRDFHFFAAPVLLYNHFWALALPVRLQTIISSVLRLSLLPQERKFIQISTYSCSIDMLHRIGYWDTDIIPEDWHIHLQAFYTLGAEVQTIPIYLPIVRDGVYAPKLMKALQIRYQQEKRWAWGARTSPMLFGSRSSLRMFRSSNG
ncbi:MAG: hypothetical protein UZ21_OP11001000147 [Microgenomates bacterium OLB22]|nr:MAG: hypothetical protein UZ21_OP11001000147 [Microgenomates bacterium OLB22]